MRIAAYVRVSTQQQAQTQTIEQQLERLQAYSQAQRWEWQEMGIFRDEGYSGASLKRPGLDRLRDQVAQANFDLVLITAPDRLARKYVHQVLLIEEFEKGGCQVEFADRPMSQDPHDQLLLQIRGVVAEYERNLITERMRRGRLQKYRAGTLLPWSTPPFGYGVDPAHPRDPAGVRLADPAAAILAEMFAYYQEAGHTLRGLAKHLTELGVPNPRGGTHWSDGTIRGILTNPVYTGIVYAGRNHYRPAKQRVSPFKPVGGGNGSIDRLPKDGVDSGGAYSAHREPGTIRYGAAEAEAESQFFQPQQQSTAVPLACVGQLWAVSPGLHRALDHQRAYLLRLQGEAEPAPVPTDGAVSVTVHPRWATGRAGLAGCLRGTPTSREARRSLNARTGGSVVTPGIAGTARKPAQSRSEPGAPGGALDRSVPGGYPPLGGIQAATTRPGAEAGGSRQPIAAGRCQRSQAGGTRRGGRVNGSVLSAGAGRASTGNL